MQTFAISTTVEPSGQLVIGSVPFAPGTEVDVVVSPRRKSGTDFESAWNDVCRRLRERSELAGLEDDQLQDEIRQHRASR